MWSITACVPFGGPRVGRLLRVLKATAGALHPAAPASYAIR
jgi:hypothetical protein